MALNVQLLHLKDRGIKPFYCDPKQEMLTKLSVSIFRQGQQHWRVSRINWTLAIYTVAVFNIVQCACGSRKEMFYLNTY